MSDNGMKMKMIIINKFFFLNLRFSLWFCLEAVLGFEFGGLFLSENKKADFKQNIVQIIVKMA